MLIKNKNKNIFIMIVIAAALIIILGSCSNNGGGDISGDNPGNADTPAENPDNQNQNGAADGLEPEFVYEFPEVNYGGADFNVINTNTKVWEGPFSDIVIEDQIGEILNDTVYNRNIQIEEAFGITLKQKPVDPNNVISEARKLITSGDDTYEAMFITHNWNGAIGTILINNGFHNLTGIPALQLDKPWWNQNIIKQLKIGGSDSLYFALNDIDVANMQFPVIMYFNEKIAQDMGLDMPYNLVRGGKWTLDEYEKYLKAGANLNGDESWKWSAGGNSVYGHASYHMGATAMLLATDVTIIDFDENNMPYFAAENEHFYNAVQKLGNILSVENQYFYTDALNPTPHRVTVVFINGRALFTDGAMSNAGLLRGMEEPFGILPMPKYDENQLNYRTHMHSGATFSTIPVTNTDPNKAAAVIDAMAYLSYKDVRPAYFDVALPHKQLRNEDSLDMLRIILDTRSIHVGYVYDWTTDLLNNSMRTEIQKSNPETASVIEKNKDKINANIQKTLDFFTGD